MKQYDRTCDADQYLMHHGIPGQKWGVRRYQNSDGSLTSRGKKRLSIKNLRDMSEQELDTRIRRMQKEKQLRDLEEGQVKSGKKWIKNIATDSLKQGLTEALKASVTVGAKYLIARGIGNKNPQIAKNIFSGYTSPDKK